MRFFSIVVFIGLFCFTIAESEPFLNTRVLSGQKRCYIEDVPEQTEMMFRYQYDILDPSVMMKPEVQRSTVALLITDPDGNVINSKNTGLKGSEKFTTVLGGEHKICITPNVLLGFFSSPIKMNLRADYVYGTDANDREIASADEIQKLEKIAVRANGRVKGIRKEMTFMKKREEQFHNTSASTSRRVKFFAFFQTVLMGACCYLQLRTLKQFFRTKKLI